MRRFRWWTVADRALLRQHYGPLAPQPLPYHDLAVLIGCAPEDVRAAARRFGLASRPWKSPRQADLLRLYAECLPDRIIGFRLNCCARTISRWRQRLGLPAVATRGYRARPGVAR